MSTNVLTCLLIVSLLLFGSMTKAQEIKKNHTRCICHQRSPRWVKARDGLVPEDAFKAGRDSNGTVYIANAYHEIESDYKHLIPGKRTSGHTKAYISYGGGVLQKENYNVLCGYGYYWVPFPSNMKIPKNAVSGGEGHFREVIYIGRIQHNKSDLIGKIYGTHDSAYFPYIDKELHFHKIDTEILIQAKRCKKN